MCQQARAWLAEGRLCPRHGLRLDLAVADRLPDEDLGAPSLALGVVDIWATPNRGLCLQWRQVPARAWLAPDSTTAIVTLTPAARAELGLCLEAFMLPVVLLLYWRVGFHHLHAAMVEAPDGTGHLLVGDTHSGKSTTTAWLASCGWRVGTDDLTFLADAPDGRVAAWAWRTPLALRPGGLALLHTPPGGQALRRTGKTGYWPEDLGGAWLAQVLPAKLLFLSVGKGGTRVTRMAPGEVLAHLVHASAWVTLDPAAADAHLRLLVRVAEQTQHYRVSLGADFLVRPTTLQEWLT